MGKLRKFYFVKYGRFSNEYELKYTDGTIAPTEGYERITRGNAVALARAEAKRRRDGISNGGFASDYIAPFGFTDEDEYSMFCGRRWMMNSDRIVERKED